MTRLWEASHNRVNFKQIFAKNLKHFRKLNSFSEEKISTLLGVSKRVYQNYTSPKSTNMPSYDSLIILADIYQKSIAEFFHS
jgi:transcriptional regulator with XRE-family HTH domain